MDNEVYIKKELETAEEEWGVQGDTEWPMETQFAEVKEANGGWIEEDGNVSLTTLSSWSWKSEIGHDDAHDVSEEIEQKFVCGFPSNIAESSPDVQELMPEESKLLLIHDGYTTLHRSSSSESYPSQHLTELQPLVVQDTPLTNNSLEEENLEFTNQRPGEKKARIQRCPVCKEVLKSAVDLRNHSLDHAEDWPYTCFMCNRVFTRRFGFHQHMLTKHGVDRPYSCNVCKLTFKEVQELNNHNFSHNGIQQYPQLQPIITISTLQLKVLFFSQKFEI